LSQNQNEAPPSGVNRKGGAGENAHERVLSRREIFGSQAEPCRVERPGHQKQSRPLLFQRSGSWARFLFIFDSLFVILTGDLVGFARSREASAFCCASKSFGALFGYGVSMPHEKCFVKWLKATTLKIYKSFTLWDFYVGEKE